MDKNNKLKKDLLIVNSIGMGALFVIGFIVIDVILDNGIDLFNPFFLAFAFLGGFLAKASKLI